MRYIPALLMNRPSILPKGQAGHLLDLWRIVTGTFHVPHSWTKYRQIVSLGRATGGDVFFEVGTFLGVTTKRCAKKFRKVWTVELDPKLCAEARRYLASSFNVAVIEGDGLKEVEKFLAETGERNVIVFLDGHFSGGATAKGDLVEPALEEIAILARHRDKIAGFIVDDFRELGTQPGWPTKWELIKSVETLFGQHGFRVAVHLDQVVVRRMRNA